MHTFTVRFANDYFRRENNTEPELNRSLLTTERHKFSHGDGWGKIVFGDVPHLGTVVRRHPEYRPILVG